MEGWFGHLDQWVCELVGERPKVGLAVVDDLSGNRGPTIDSPPPYLQLCVYCGSAITWRLMTILTRKSRTFGWNVGSAISLT